MFLRYVVGLNFIFILFVVTVAQRRILNGSEIGETEYKRYVVYLAKSNVSLLPYDAWLCGGALVSTDYIITSAACVEDVQHLYAVAGYNTYVKDVYNDKCTAFVKKKIVYTCVPQAYKLEYDRLEKWSYIDIAIVKVETPYDFSATDQSYKEHGCDYAPRAIQVNYEDKFQEPNIDAIALGWGHTEKWRKDDDSTNYNVPKLQYASILIANKTECKELYKDYPNMEIVIDKYMICSLGEGNINSQGMLKKHSPPADGCGNSSQTRLLAFEGTASCEDGAEDADIVFVENTRKNTKAKTNNINEKVEDNATIVNMFRKQNITNNTFDNIKTRRHGICQNDHGGPIVTWVGSHEVLIGVASVFKVSHEYKCEGPFLYTSTQCSGAFLNCILTSGENQPSSRKDFCDSPPEVKGFNQIETTISWRDHPDGPAMNERYLVRPLHPIYGNGP